MIVFHFKGAQKISWKEIKAAKKLLKSSPSATDVLYLIMFHIDGNVDKKFQLSIFYRSRENHTDRQIF